MPLAAAPGQARAGRVTTAMLPLDRTGLAHWSASDYLVANDRIAVMIEDVGPSDLYDPWGGGVVGISRVAGGAMVEPADFEEFVFGLGRFILQTESVTVLRDGAAGGTAIVRAVGNFRPLPFINQLARPIAPAPFDDIRAAVDYELEPNADHVDVYGTFNVTRAQPVDVGLVLHGFFQRYRMDRFSGESGFEIPTGSATNAWVGFIDDFGASYAWQATDSALMPVISVAGFDGFTQAPIVFPACDQTRRRIGRLHVGGPGLDGLRIAMARTRSEALREIRGTVNELDGSPAIGVRVHATSTDDRTYFSRATTDAGGAFVVHVPSTQSARLTAYRLGDSVPGPIDVSVGTSTAAIRLGSRGSIHIVATDATRMTALPVRVQVLPLDGPAPSVPVMFGEHLTGGGRLHIAFPHTGDVTLPAPPGRYRLVVSHGFEYEIVDQEVSVTAGATVEVRAALLQSVDSTGIQCADFHVHTSRSPDAPDPARDKLRSLVGDGVEIAVRSDHDYVADFAPLVRELGLERWAFPIPSLELTTFAWGHFGVVPLAPDPTRINAGAPDWTGRMPVDVFNEARARPGSPTVIINHPRMGGAFGGYFEAVRFNRDTGTAGNAAMWDTQFTVVEFFTDASFDHNRDTTVADWFSMLNHGRRVFAVGSSDSHQVIPSSPVGYPRTCMFLGTDDPRALSASAVRDAAAQGRSVVSGGVLVTASVGAAGPGQEATGVGAMARVSVTVQAPQWVPVERLEVIVDAQSRVIRTLDASTRDPMNPTVRFRGEFDVPVLASGSWLIVVAEAAGDLAPVHPGRNAFGVTNPIFLRR